MREVLHRELYRGRVIWNRTEKRDQWGQKRQRRREPSEWITLDAEHLRIVPEALWQEVQARLAAVRQVYLRFTEGKLWGHPAIGLESKYLLTGLATCGECGGTIYVHGRTHGAGHNKRRVHFYGCSAHWHRGNAVCKNGLVVPIAVADEAVLSAFEEQLLNPDALARGFQQALATLRTPPAAGELESAQRELAAINEQLANLAQGIKMGGILPTLVAESQNLERQKADLLRRIERLEQTAETFSDADASNFVAKIQERLGNWRELLREKSGSAQRLLRKLLSERIKFTRREDAYEFVARCSLAKFAEAEKHPRRWWPQRGSNPCFSLERAVS